MFFFHCNVWLSEGRLNFMEWLNPPWYSWLCSDDKLFAAMCCNELACCIAFNVNPRWIGPSWSICFNWRFTPQKWWKNKYENAENAALKQRSVWFVQGQNFADKWNLAQSLSLPVRCEDCWQDLASVRCQATLSDGSFWLVYIYTHNSTILVIWWGCNRDIHSAMAKIGYELNEYIYNIYISI